MFTERALIRRNFLTDADAAERYIDGVRRLKDPAQFPWPGQDGLSIYDSFVFWHHQTMMLMTPPTQSDRNAAHSGPLVPALAPVFSHHPGGVPAAGCK